MTPDEFCRKYDKRVRQYAARTATRFCLPAHLRHDLHQACYIAIVSKLKSWRADAGKSAFNWCASGMRKQMVAEIRRYHGNKPFGWRREITYFLESMGDQDYGKEDTDATLRIDLENVLKADPKPQQVQLYVEAALNPKSGGDMSAERGMTRQAISYHVLAARDRLQEACRAKGVTP